MTTKIQARPIFAATLTPYRSLTPTGKRVVVGLTAALALVPGFVFYVAGAWPVVGFMGLDVLAIWWAFSVSLGAGRAYEVLTVWRGALELRKVDAKGYEEVLAFAPSAVRFVVERDYNERVTALWLTQAGRRVALGSFLSTDEKLSLSKAFGAALRKARA